MELNKFKLTLKRASPPAPAEVHALEKWRALFYKLHLIGEYPNEKIGFGNLSYRLPDKRGFIITGAQTGHIVHLQPHHYSRVVQCDLIKGHVLAEGVIAPSSEALIHYGLYEADSEINYIFHVHHHRLWEYLQANGPEVQKGIIVMKGHQDEIIAFGPSADEAGKLVLDLYRKIITGEPEE